MRHSTQPLYVVRNTPEVSITATESFGRIARSTASATPALLAPARRSANESDIASHELCDARARRAMAASGFGDAALDADHKGQMQARHDTHGGAVVVAPVGERPAAPSAMQLEAAARAERSRLLGDIAAQIWRPVAQRLRNLLKQAQQRRDARATYLALRELDARTLHDIGIHRSEILSVALELSGAFEATRVQSTRAPRGR
jgi:uncharacterized protein YjiS (DUF1127 family)